MSQSITGVNNTVQTLSPSRPVVSVSGTINAYGTVGQYSADINGSLTSFPAEAALFGPATGHFTITNSGLIESHGSVPGNLFDLGILLGAPGTIRNSGTILGGSGIAVFGTAGNSYIENSKLISGSFGAGIVIFGGTLNAATIVNSGTIAGSPSYSTSGGIVLFGNGIVTNSATGLVIADHSYGIGAMDGRLTVGNAGTIIGLYGGINLQNGGFASNSGYIHATGTGALTNSSYAGINADLGGTIFNSGTVVGQNGINVHYGYGTITSAIQGYIRNSGVIRAISASPLNSPNSDDAGIGLALQMPGTIINAGLVTASNAGIYVNNGTANIQNLAGGTIISAFGIYLSQNSNNGTPIANVGSINNAGTVIASIYGVTLGGAGSVQNTGLISGYREAIRDKTASATIINSGVIIATGSTFVVPGATSSSNGFPTGTYISHGIQLTQGGTVINQAGGTIEGQTAIDLKGAGEYVSNAGLVTAAGHAGVYLHGHGSVNNSGSIRASNPAIELYSGGNVINSGLAASSAKAGIYLKLAGSVTNSGTVTGAGPAILLADGGAVFNTGTAIGKAGIAVSLASGYVLNQKFADGTVNTGIYLQDGGTISNTGFAAGAIHGIEIFSGSGIATNSGTITGGIGALLLGGGTLIDSGTIIGTAGDAVSLAAGFANRLVIEPGASFSGIVDGGNHLGAAVISTLEFASAAAANTFSGAGLNAQFVDFSSIVIDRGATVTFTGATTLSVGETLTDYGTITFTGAVIDAGLIIADPATIIFNSAVTGPGTLDVNTGDTIIFNGSVSSTETIDFVSPGGTIFINDPSQFNATIINPVNGTEIFACFAAGTRILTPRGEIAVEKLREGDIVITTDGEDVPIKWIGYRSIDLTKTRHPEKAQPIRIDADAIAQGVPARDLHLSPDHALYFENHLIPAKALLNNRNVTQLQKAKITYYHIELATHAAIFAEMTPCETYLETGNRTCFENATVTSLEPDFNPEKFQAQREAESFAPFCETGPAARALRTKLLDRAFIYQDRRSA